MGRFERGLARLEQNADADGLDAIETLRRLHAEHRAQQTPLERYISDQLTERLDAKIWSDLGTPEPLTLDELVAMSRPSDAELVDEYRQAVRDGLR